MSLDARVQVTLGRLDCDVSLAIERGEVVALLGPNGAGKSTLLRCLAGLQPLDGGRLTVDDHVLDDPEAGVFVPPEQRPVGVVFQDYLLFPHLSALENVAFGLRARGMGRDAARREAAGWLERVGLADHAAHRPGSLSGGQAQRVALARALATTPRLLLLDEPLAALDAGTRGGVRRDLRRYLRDFDGMTLLVTHDPIDAHALADRVLVLEAGQVVQAGTLAQVTAHPRSPYVAELVGLNLFTGTVTDGTFVTDRGERLVTASHDVEGPAFAAVEPHAVSLFPAPPAGSPRNVWHTVVADIDQRGDRVRVLLEGDLALVAEVTTGALAELRLRPGDAVWAAIKATAVTTYPA